MAVSSITQSLRMVLREVRDRLSLPPLRSTQKQLAQRPHQAVGGRRAGSMGVLGDKLRSALQLSVPHPKDILVMTLPKRRAGGMTQWYGTYLLVCTRPWVLSSGLGKGYGWGNDN